MENQVNDLIHEKESYILRGAVYRVYHVMGAGFLEAVYQECMEVELTKRGIPFKAKPKLQLYYHSTLLKTHYQPDFICYDKIILELKAVQLLTNEHRAQLINYLKATGYKLGFLINFSSYPKVQIDRLVI